MDTYQRIIHKIKHDIAQRNSKGKPKYAFYRVPSKVETELKLEAKETPKGFFASGLYCIHKKSYFSECTHCKRDKREAAKRFAHFCEKHGIPM
jgi:hypothetical protein